MTEGGRVKKRLVVMLLFVFALSFLGFAQADGGPTVSEGLYFIGHSHGYVGVINKVADFRKNDGYGWEGDAYSGFDMFGYKNYFFSFDGTIRTISRSQPFVSDFYAVYYNLVPGLGCEYGRHKVVLILNHWSEHYYPPYSDPSYVNRSLVKNINNVGLRYAYSGIDDLLSIFSGYPALGAANNYDYSWNGQLNYRHNINIFYFDTYLEVARMNGSVVAGYQMDYGFTLNKSAGRPIDMFFGYGFGHIVIPTGAFIGTRINF